MKSTLPLPTLVSTEAHLIVSAPDRRITCSIPIACYPAKLFDVWSDVAHWHTWDPDTKWARLDQPFAQGSTGKLAPQKGMAVNIVISQATPNQSFTAESRVLGNRMIFTHTLQETSGGIIATHEVHFQGWLAGLFMKTVGADVCKGLPLTMTRLKHLCEASNF